jgi:hypothetical protein
VIMLSFNVSQNKNNPAAPRAPYWKPSAESQPGGREADGARPTAQVKRVAARAPPKIR